MEGLEIVEFEEKYHGDLKKLSYAWLEKYDLLEPEDEKILNNPKEIVLDGGGSIFLAKLGKEIVGTSSIIKIKDDTFELAKLAVCEKYQRLSIGRKLMETCFSEARRKGAKKIILYSNHKLSSALILYEKLGFKYVTHVNTKYVESDVKMELNL